MEYKSISMFSYVGQDNNLKSGIKNILFEDHKQVPDKSQEFSKLLNEVEKIHKEIFDDPNCIVEGVCEPLGNLSKESFRRLCEWNPWYMRWFNVTRVVLEILKWYDHLANWDTNHHEDKGG